MVVKLLYSVALFATVLAKAAIEYIADITTRAPETPARSDSSSASVSRSIGKDEDHIERGLTGLL